MGLPVLVDNCSERIGELVGREVMAWRIVDVVVRSTMLVYVLARQCGVLNRYRKSHPRAEAGAGARTQTRLPKRNTRNYTNRRHNYFL